MTITTNQLELVRSVVRASADRPASPTRAAGRQPVVTISRAAGIDVDTLLERLVQALEHSGSDDAWMAYDSALVERVAEDHNLSQDLVDRLDEADKTWFEHLTEGLSGRATGTDVAIKVAKTIRGLARVGHAIIVGRGAQCILREVPAAVHVRLDASTRWRAARIAASESVLHQDAERQLREIDREREHFVRYHFGRDVADLALYDVIINVEHVAEPRAARIIAELVASVDMPDR